MLASTSQHARKLLKSVTPAPCRTVLEATVTRPEFQELHDAATIRAQVLKPQLWTDITFLHSFFEPFSKAITMLEKDSARLSDVYFIHRDLDILVRDKLSLTNMLLGNVSFYLAFHEMQAEWEERKVYCNSPAIPLAAIMDHRWEQCKLWSGMGKISTVCGSAYLVSHSPLKCSYVWVLASNLTGAAGVVVTMTACPNDRTDRIFTTQQ